MHYIHYTHDTHTIYTVINEKSINSEYDIILLYNICKLIAKTDLGSLVIRITK